MSTPHINVQEIARQALASTEAERAAHPKPTLFGPDGRPVSSGDPAPKPKLFTGNNEPVKRSIDASDIEGLDPSKPQFIYARTPDGRPPSHGNDYKFFAHEMEPKMMKEVDPGVVFIGSTTPRPMIPKPKVRAAPPPRNRRERRQAEARARKGV